MNLILTLFVLTVVSLAAYMLAPRKRRGAFYAACVLLLLVMASVCMAGDIVTRRADSWTTATGTNITAGLWENWTVDKIEFYRLFPTNTTVTISVKYAVGNYTQAVGTAVGDVNGDAYYSNDVQIAYGDIIQYTPGTASTGKVVTTYRKHNP